MLNNRKWQPEPVAVKFKGIINSQIEERIRPNSDLNRKIVNFRDLTLFPDLIGVELKEKTAGEADRFKWGERIREVEQEPEGALYVLEDSSGGRLLKLTPIRKITITSGQGALIASILPSR